MATVSVIMPIFNTKPEYIEQSVNSILDQTFNDFELVIIDDGSKEKDTVRCVESLPLLDERIRVIKNDSNLGIPTSLNKALDSCLGKYIARMDSDDICCPDRFERQVDYMENHLDVCLSGTRIFIFSDDDSQRVSIRSAYFSDPRVWKIDLLFRNMVLPHPTFMIRRSFIDDNGIRYRENTYAEDYAFQIDCILAGGNLHLIDEPLLEYRIHGGQFSKITIMKQWDSLYCISHQYITSVFGSLTTSESWAISKIGYFDQEYSPDTYIVALKKMFEENHENKIFDEPVFKRVLYYAWYKKCKAITRMNRKPWGIFRLFTLQALPSVLYINALMKIENRVIKKVTYCEATE